MIVISQENFLPAMNCPNNVVPTPRLVKSNILSEYNRLKALLVFDFTLF